MGRKPNTDGIKVNPEDIAYESMIFYISWYKQLLKLKEVYGIDTYIRGFEELCNYSFHGTIPDNSDNPVLEMFFDMARASIDSNIKYRIIGKMGSDARWGKNIEPEKKERRKRTPKKKEEPEVIPETVPDDDDEGWIEPTPENIARSIAEYEEWENGVNGTG